MTYRRYKFQTHAWDQMCLCFNKSSLLTAIFALNPLRARLCTISFSYRLLRNKIVLGYAKYINDNRKERLHAVKVKTMTASFTKSKAQQLDSLRSMEVFSGKACHYIRTRKNCTLGRSYDVWIIIFSKKRFFC